MRFAQADQRMLVTNFTSGFAKILAEEFGVSVETLRTLGVGYLPVMQFNLGKELNRDGQWTFPERDAAGKIIGFALRNRETKYKSQIPDSKRGLFFAPGHVRQDFLDKWARIMSLGIECPICGKPDYCLVDAEDTDNPSAVVCTRIEADSTRPFGDWWLHVLDPKRYKDDHAPTLPVSYYPVMIVEGAQDTLRLTDLGFVAIGKPSASFNSDALSVLCKGRDVVVFGENDAKDGGLWPGKKGAEKTAKDLHGIAKSVRIVFPPADIKDISDGWEQTRDSLLAYIESYSPRSAIHPQDADALPDDAPHTVAKAYLAEKKVGADYTTRYYQQEWYTYGEDGWRKNTEKDMFEVDMTAFMQRTNFAKVSGRGNTAAVKLVPLDTAGHNIRNAVGNVRPIVQVHGDMPVWLDGEGSSAPERTLLFANGMLSVDRYLSGDYQLEAHTPNLFSTTRLPYAFDPNAKCPVWDAWLLSTLGDDPTKIDLLQEWLGYNLIPDTSEQKMMIFYGPAGTGKSTAIDVLMRLVGVNGTASSLQHLVSPFGLGHLHGKLVATMPDARMPTRGGEMCTQKVLELTSGDTMLWSRKFLGEVSGKFVCRLTIASNHLPDLPDDSDALDRRNMYIRFNTSFKDNPDKGLRDKLRDEMPGIITWALKGLASLKSQGEFTKPTTHEQDRIDFRSASNPIGEFVDQWIVEDANAKEPSQVVYEAWKQFVTDNPVRKHSTMMQLYQRLSILIPGMKRITEEQGATSTKYWTGIRVRNFARRAGETSYGDTG